MKYIYRGFENLKKDALMNIETGSAGYGLSDLFINYVLEYCTAWIYTLNALISLKTRPTISLISCN